MNTNRIKNCSKVAGMAVTILRFRRFTGGSSDNPPMLFCPSFRAIRTTIGGLEDCS